MIKTIYTAEAGDHHEGYFPIFSSNSKDYVERMVERHNQLVPIIREAVNRYLINVEDGCEDFDRYEKIKKRLFKDMVTEDYCYDKLITDELKYLEVEVGGVKWDYRE